MSKPQTAGGQSQSPDLFPACIRPNTACYTIPGEMDLFLSNKDLNNQKDK